MTKKSQTKIQQTAFMLVAVTLFLALAGIFVLGFGLSGLKNKASNIEEENAILLASKIANTPEFSCGQAFGNKLNCIDMDKVLALKSEIQNYGNFWGIEDIKIRKIYPPYTCLEIEPNCDFESLESNLDLPYSMNIYAETQEEFLGEKINWDDDRRVKIICNPYGRNSFILSFEDFSDNDFNDIVLGFKSEEERITVLKYYGDTASVNDVHIELSFDEPKNISVPELSFSAKKKTFLDISLWDRFHEENSEIRTLLFGGLTEPYEFPGCSFVGNSLNCNKNIEDFIEENSETCSEEIECTLSNYPECGIVDLISEEVVGTYNSVFVSLCRKEYENEVYDKCELGKLMVSYNEK